MSILYHTYCSMSIPFSKFFILPWALRSKGRAQAHSILTPSRRPAVGFPGPGVSPWRHPAIFWRRGGGLRPWYLPAGFGLRVCIHTLARFPNSWGLFCAMLRGNAKSKIKGRTLRGHVNACKKYRGFALTPCKNIFLLVCFI